MAQKTGKEETEFKVPETLSLCVNNCGFTGNPTTNNMCQKCFNNAIIVASHKVASSEASRSGSTDLQLRPQQAKDSGRDLKRLELWTQEISKPAKREVNRCSGCRKRVGLTGFRCRCGELFCAEHRYSDRHDCSFDYKEAGRQAIARENPVVKAAKIVKL